MIDGLILWLAKMQIPYRQNEESRDTSWVHTKASFAQGVFKMSASPTKLSLWPTKKFPWGLTFCRLQEDSSHICKLKGSNRAGQGNLGSEEAKKKRLQRKESRDSTSCHQLPLSGRPALSLPGPVPLVTPDWGSHGQGVCGFEYFLPSPGSPEKLSVNLSTTHTYSPMTGSLQTEICTLQSLMKFVLTPKSKVMRRKLVHSLTRQFQTAVLKLQKDIFFIVSRFQLTTSSHPILPLLVWTEDQILEVSLN